MPNPLIGVAAVGAGASVAGARSQSRAASQASDAQVRAAELSIEEQRRQFDAVQELLAPFVETGTTALSETSALLGLSGPDAQAQALQAVEGSPELATIIQQGEDAILANAAATGGLRGGNVQRSLAQFRPQAFNQVLGQRFQRLGGLTQIGQAGAAGQAAAAQNLGQGVSQQLGQIGAAQAGGALAAGQAQAQAFGGVGQALGTVFGAGIPAGGIPTGQGIFTRWGF